MSLSKEARRDAAARGDPTVCAFKPGQANKDTIRPVQWKIHPGIGKRKVQCCFENQTFISFAEIVGLLVPGTGHFYQYLS